MSVKSDTGLSDLENDLNCLFLAFVVITCIATAGLAVPVWLLIFWLIGRFEDAREAQRSQRRYEIQRRHEEREESWGHLSEQDRQEAWQRWHDEHGE